MTRFSAGAATDVGRVRAVNQDHILVADDVFAVADGMGGHRGGEVASAVAVEALESSFRSRTPDALVEAVRSANHAVVDKAEHDPELRGMGTTLCALASVRRDDGEEVLTIVNVGDSRAYLLKTGEDRLVQISEDHSLVQQLFRQGQLTADAAAVHPQRNILTRALGIDADVKPDAFLVLPVKGDRYVLCSDGLFNEVDEPKIADVLRTTPDPGQAAEVLVRLANEGGGRDNISVVVVDIIDDTGHHEWLEAESNEHRVVDVVRYDDRPIDSGEPRVIDRSLLEDGASGAPAGTIVKTGEAPAVTVNRRSAPAPEPEPGPPGEGVFVDKPLIQSDVWAGARPPATAVATVPRHEPRTRFTWRVALFLIAFIGIFAGAIYAVNFVAENTYYVGEADGQVAIYRGKPGGVLWRKPSIVESTDMKVDDVLKQFQGAVSQGKEEPSLAEARKYAESVRRPPTTTTTTTTLDPSLTVPTLLDPAVTITAKPGG